jgi:hypothetical protein
MNAVIGQQFGILQDPVRRLRLPVVPWQVKVFDMCAGDGRYGAGESFHRNTSPGNWAFHAQHRSAEPTALQVDGHLYEVKYETFCDLRTFMIEHLPKMHELKSANGRDRHAAPYVKESVSQEHVTFKAGRTTITLHHGNAAEADLEDVDYWTAVVLSHDPNSMGGTWPLAPEFLAQLKGKTSLATMINTMGCNPGGLMMLPVEVRKTWFYRVTQIDRAVWDRHDTLLVAIDGDSQKWGYAFTVPLAFGPDTLRSVTAAFAKIGYALEAAWLRADPDGAKRIQDMLFLRAEEREAGK